MRLSNYINHWLFLILVSFGCSSYAETAPQLVGHISFVKGSNAAQLPGAEPRILGKDTEIFQGDNIQTTERSFVMIDFIDGTKVTVRPNSNFSIDHFDASSANKSVQLALYQGGVNAMPGELAKGKPDTFQIKTPNSTIKPNSEKAEFNVRICDKACAEKESQIESKRTPESVVARVVEIKGEVNALNRADKKPQERLLALGKPLYNSDFIHSEKDSYALMVFPDGQKVSLQPESEMDIKEYFYQVPNKKDNVMLKLATGGLRSITGGVGKADHSAYSLETPVATIGIRGTTTYTFIGHAQNMEHRTESGLSFVRDNNGEWDVSEGFTLLKADPAAKPTIFQTPSNATQPLGSKSGPNDSDTKKLFQRANPVFGDTLVDAKNGRVVVENNSGDRVELEEGETGNAKSKGEPVVLSNQWDHIDSGINADVRAAELANMHGFPSNTPDSMLDGCY